MISNKARLILITFVTFFSVAAIAFDQSSPPNSLVVNTTGNVGIGSDTPDVALHVKREAAVLSVTDTNQSRATRSLILMSNLGPNGFSMEDRERGETWEFRSDNAGSFNINRKTVPGAEFLIKENGQVKIGPGSVTNFDLTASGDLVIPNGDVTANGILLTSSRDSKTDIKEINPSDIMKRLAKMDLAEWRYKKAEKHDRHLSPMAEDFYALFKLGRDDKHINPNDLASVAIVAAKELQKESSSIRAENKSLKKQLNEQSKRLASLEKLVTNLAMGSDSLAKQGKEVARNNTK